MQMGEHDKQQLFGNFGCAKGLLGQIREHDKWLQLVNFEGARAYLGSRWNTINGKRLVTSATSRVQEPTWAAGGARKWRHFVTLVTSRAHEHLVYL